MARRNSQELEAAVGQQIRVLRKRAQMTQRELARAAGVSTSTISSLETGAGTSLSTLIAVLRELDREDWLDDLAPPATVSPMALLAKASRTRR